MLGTIFSFAPLVRQSSEQRLSPPTHFHASIAILIPYRTLPLFHIYGRIFVQMTAGLMRRLFSSSTRVQIPSRVASNHLSTPRLLGLKQYQRHLTGIRPLQASVSGSRTWFTSTSACPLPEGPDGQPPDERTLNLGRSRSKFCMLLDPY